MIKYEVEVYPRGDKFWFLNGKPHREDGPAYEWADGDKVWYLNGKFHREDGPAYEWADGGKEWYLNGERHREDGPAVENASGYKRWYLNGKCMSEAKHKRATSKRAISKKPTCEGKEVEVDGVTYVLRLKGE